MLGCWVHVAFTLEYGGPFSCEPVPYLTAGAAAAVVVALLVAKICWKRKQNWTKMKSGRMQKHVDRYTQYRQLHWSDFPIRSWYPGYMGSSIFPQVFYPSISLITARIRRMGEGTVFSLSVHTRGGGVPGPGQGRGGTHSKVQVGGSQVQVQVGGYLVSGPGGGGSQVQLGGYPVSGAGGTPSQVQGGTPSQVREGTPSQVGGYP